MQLPFQVLRFFHLASLLLPLTTFAGAACFSGPHLCKQRKTCSPGVTAGQLQDGSAPDSAGAQMVYYLRQNVSPSHYRLSRYHIHAAPFVISSAGAAAR